MPSQILYKEEFYKVVAFSSFKGSANNSILSFDKIGNYTQVIEFDNRLNDTLNPIYIDESYAIIKNTPTAYNELLKILNYPLNLYFKCIYLKKLEIFTYNKNYNGESIAFEGCPALKELNIPNGATSLYHNDFQGCNGLEKLTIPDSVTKIYHNIFGLNTTHLPTLKIYFHSQQTMDLFLKTNPDDAKYCQLLPN